MAKSKNNSYLEEASLLVFLFVALWVFDNPLARRILGDLEVVAAVLAGLTLVTLLAFVALKRPKREKLNLIRTHHNAIHKERAVKAAPISTLLNHDPRRDRRPLPALASPVLKEKPREWTLELLKTLEWKRFEMLCAGFYEAKGYHPKSTGLGADGGIDIILYRKGDPGGKVFGIVQCKAWRKWKVNVKHVRELYGVKAAEDAALAVFITTSDYTADAKAFAEDKHLELITGKNFLSLLKGLPEPQSAALLKQVTLGDYTTPTCSHCGIKMVIKTTQNGKNAGKKYWGCRNSPRCRQTIKISSS